VARCPSFRANGAVLAVGMVFAIVNGMDTLWLDLRFALRGLLRRPGFTCVAALTLAFGIGATTAIFSFVNGLLLRPLPYGDPQQLVTVWENREARGGPVQEWTGMANFRDWWQENETFTGMAAVTGWGPSLTGGGEPEILTGGVVGAEYFQVLGVPMLHGRGFTAEEGQPGGPAVAVLAHGLWQRRFGGDPGILGRQLLLDGEEFTVVGVLPPRFQAPILTGTEIFSPMVIDPSRDDRGNLYLRVVGRLKEETSLAVAGADMQRVAAAIGESYPEEYKDVAVTLVPMHQFITGTTTRPLLVLLSAVALVLLLACVNVAGLLLARGVSRQREMALRGALGAGRRRLLRQLLTESVVLAALGGGLGLLLGAWGMEGLRWLAPAGTPRLAEVALDGRVLLFTVAVTLVTGLAFGLAPAWALARCGPGASLKESGAGAMVGTVPRRLLRGLVVAEVAVALTLLVGAGLLIKSFHRMGSVDPGFVTQGVAMARLSLPEARYGEPHQIAAFYQALQEQLAADPAVTEAGLASYVPLSPFGNDTSIVLEGQPLPEPGREPVAWYRFADPGYFSTLEIPLVQGRLFAPTDVEGAPPVVLISETMARRFFPEGEPVGQRLRPGGVRSTRPWCTIVGVVGDVQQRGLDQAPLDEMYFPAGQSPRRSMAVVLRGSGEAAALAPVLRRAVGAVDADLPVGSFTTMADQLAVSKASPRFTMVLLAALAACAVLLAAVGIYGVMAFGVSRRTREIGIRVALGADRLRVVRLVAGQGLLLAAGGIALGLVAAFALTRGLASLLFEVQPHDPAVFAALSGFLVLVTFCACYIPARRAARVDPQVALREE